MSNKAANFWNTSENLYAYAAPGIGGCGDIERPYREMGELRTLVKYLPGKSFSMLDLGCGDGRWGKNMAARLNCYEGVDISEPLIEKARELCKHSAYRHLNFNVGDLLTYQPLKKNYDVIYLAGVSMYFTDQELGEIARRFAPYIAPNGFFIDRSTVICNMDRYVNPDPSYPAIYRSASTMEDIFKKSGLRLVADEQSYPFLRMPQLWQGKELVEFMEWGFANMPGATYALMEKFSRDISSRTDFLCHEGDKVYDHRFFVYAPEKPIVEG